MELSPPTIWCKRVWVSPCCMTRSASFIHRKCVNFLFSYSLFLFLCTYFLSGSLLSKVLLVQVFFIICQCSLNQTRLTVSYFFAEVFILYFNLLSFFLPDTADYHLWVGNCGQGHGGEWGGPDRNSNGYHYHHRQEWSCSRVHTSAGEKKWRIVVTCWAFTVFPELLEIDR